MLLTADHLPAARSARCSCLLIPREEEGLLAASRFAVSLVTFGVSLFMLGDFDPAAWNHVVDKEWVAAFGIHFKLGVDGISLWLVLLTTFLMPIVLVSTWNVDRQEGARVRRRHAHPRDRACSAPSSRSTSSSSTSSGK